MQVILKALILTLSLINSLPTPPVPIVPTWEILEFANEKMTIDEFGVHFRQILVNMADANELPVAHLTSQRREAFFDKATAGAMQELKRMRKEKAAAAELQAAKEYIKSLSQHANQHGGGASTSQASAAEALPVPKSQRDASNSPIRRVAEAKEIHPSPPSKESLPERPPPISPKPASHPPPGSSPKSVDPAHPSSSKGFSNSPHGSSPIVKPGSSSPAGSSPTNGGTSPTKETSFWDWFFPDSSEIPRRMYPAGRI